MPSWFVHTQAAMETMKHLKAGVPAGSTLTQAEADELFRIAHEHRNYLAVGALGPDLFFLLPDYLGSSGTSIRGMVDFSLSGWKKFDETFVEPWEHWVSPVLDEQHRIVNALSGDMIR